MEKGTRRARPRARGQTAAAREKAAAARALIAAAADMPGPRGERARGIARELGGAVAAADPGQAHALLGALATLGPRKSEGTREGREARMAVLVARARGSGADATAPGGRPATGLDLAMAGAVRDALEGRAAGLGPVDAAGLRALGREILAAIAEEDREGTNGLLGVLLLPRVASRLAGPGNPMPGAAAAALGAGLAAVDWGAVASLLGVCPPPAPGPGIRDAGETRGAGGTRDTGGGADTRNTRGGADAPGGAPSLASLAARAVGDQARAGGDRSLAGAQARLAAGVAAAWGRARGETPEEREAAEAVRLATAERLRSRAGVPDIRARTPA